MERNDWELVRRTQEGDRDAFRELVERYQRRILGLVTGMLHDREAAQEVAQETFIKAFRSIDGFKGDSSFYTWLYRIAVNLSIDHQRREWKKPIVDIAARVRDEDTNSPGGPAVDAMDRLPDAGARFDPLAAAQNSELRESVRRAIDELTPDHKAVILLREVEGLSYEEISRVMECSKGTVMSRLHYARRKLQARLKEHL